MSKRNNISKPRKYTRAHSMLELLVATVIATLVVVGSILLFIGGVRLSLGMQATSHSLRTGSSSTDRMRQRLEEATAVQLPDDADPLTVWPEKSLGKSETYQSSQGKQTLNTAVFLSLPSTQNLIFRTSAKQTQTLAVTGRRIQTRGMLLYRGDISGTPAPSTGGYLWQWLYENGAVVSKTAIYRKLSPTWDAVTFRRGDQNGSVLRYRVLLVEKDSYNNERSALGAASGTTLETSDSTVALLNNDGTALPIWALPNDGVHP